MCVWIDWLSRRCGHYTRMCRWKFRSQTRGCGVDCVGWDYHCCCCCCCCIDSLSSCHAFCSLSLFALFGTRRGLSLSLCFPVRPKQGIIDMSSCRHFDNRITYVHAARLRAHFYHVYTFKNIFHRNIHIYYVYSTSKYLIYTHFLFITLEKCFFFLI